MLPSAMDVYRITLSSRRHGMLSSILFQLLSYSGLGRALKSSADYWIESLPGLSPSIDQASLYGILYHQYAGNIEVDSTAQNTLFFWLIRSQINQPRDKLIIWLNGGPGCSSMDGMFMEFGPFQATKDNVLELNQNAWSRNAHLLFVDQPAGTGFSTVASYDVDQVSATNRLLTFIENFFAIFPEFRKAEIYIGGESYAGIYVPYLANEILKRKESQNLNPPDLDLRGLIIGNGWIDPLSQYPAYYDYAVQNNILSGEYAKWALQDIASCRKAFEIDKPKIYHASCDMIVERVIYQSRAGNQPCINMYDIRLKDSQPNMDCGLSEWPKALPHVTEYLRRPDVTKAIHATLKTIPWMECDNRVAGALRNDQSPPSIGLLPYILSKIPVLLFSGNKDLICNHVGTEMMLANLTWNGETGMSNNSVKYDYVMNNKTIGMWQTSRNMTYVLFYDASHMPAVDSPEGVFSMMNRFMGVHDTSRGVSMLVDPFYSNTTYPTWSSPTSVPSAETVQVYYGWVGVVVAILIMTLFVCVLALVYIRSRKRSGKGGSNWHELQATEEYEDQEQMFDSDQYLGPHINGVRKSTSPTNGRVMNHNGGPRFEIDD
ncbi:hypothetical protein SeMB42_g02496 [Synchytrium endobioticum]|uniref:Carboxypeptidase n=1 Tax=Synchytrium endobioticum TaxID=286115 RepID=A0A507DDX2_9FUNG|nr:hypothetical protein SeMB42_g02496 [Synchytrium endobioticum]